jgi:Co/Zn/Cd efflux system component
MSTKCCSPSCEGSSEIDPKYRRILWLALCANAAMFAVEIGGSLMSGSMSLLADAVDFAGDAANYGLSLAVLSMGLLWRARAALVKGISMAAFGIFVLARTAWLALEGGPPDPITMGAIALLALTVNVGVAVLLYTYRRGDANMRSVWLCSRNDALGNVAVMLAAAGVLGTGSGWPDLVVATLMATLALSAGASVVRMARQEITTAGVRAAEFGRGPIAAREH